MTNLQDYVLTYAERGACQCGKCIDAPSNPEQHQPTGHTADLVFFKVSAKSGADADTLELLVLDENQAGDYCNVNLFDGKEHSYIELGAWIGDQGLALTMMGLGSVLGVWQLLTPMTVLGKDAPADLIQQMAGAGYISIVAQPKEKTCPKSS